MDDESNYTTGAGYRGRRYPSFSGRIDHNIYGAASYEREMTSSIVGEATTDIGVNMSSLSDYSRVYLDLGALVDADLPNRWTWTNSVFMRNSFYTSRTVITNTEVNVRRRGRPTTTSRTDRESYRLTTFSSELTREETKTLTWRIAAVASDQKSKSGQLDYSVIEVTAGSELPQFGEHI